MTRELGLERPPTAQKKRGESALRRDAYGARAAALTELQRMAGNAAVSRLLASHHPDCDYPVVPAVLGDRAAVQRDDESDAGSGPVAGAPSPESAAPTVGEEPLASPAPDAGAQPLSGAALVSQWEAVVVGPCQQARDIVSRPLPDYKQASAILHSAVANVTPIVTGIPDPLLSQKAKTRVNGAFGVANTLGALAGGTTPAQVASLLGNEVANEHAFESELGAAGTGTGPSPGPASP